MITIEESRKLTTGVAQLLRAQFERHGISNKLGARLLNMPSESFARWARGEYDAPCVSFLIAYDLLKKLSVLPNLAFGKLARGTTEFDNSYKTVLYYFRPEMALIEETVANAQPSEHLQGYEGTEAVANDVEDNTVA